MAKAGPSTSVSSRTFSRAGASSFHCFLASLGNHDGGDGAIGRGFGSLSLSGRLPGLPSSTFRAVGFGFRPRIAMVSPPISWNVENPGISRRQEENRSEEHTSELQSRENLVCRLLLEKKKTE